VQRALTLSLLSIAVGAACSNGNPTSTTTGTTVHHTTGSPSGTATATAANGSTGGVGSATATGTATSTNGSSSGGQTPDGGCLPCGKVAPYCVYGVCRECRASSDCSTPYPGQPYCVSLDAGGSYAGECVACLTDAQCPSGACDPSTYTCAVNCVTTPSACTGDQYCEPDSGACVECLNYTQCLTGQVCTNGSCGGCGVDGDCNPDSGLPFCNPETRCSECKCPPDAGGGLMTCPSTACDSGLCISGSFTCQ
jgi:hypothetical protein